MCVIGNIDIAVIHLMLIIYKILGSVASQLSHSGLLDNSVSKKLSNRILSTITNVELTIKMDCVFLYDKYSTSLT